MIRITIDLTDSLASPEYNRLASFLETDCNIRHKYSAMKQEEIADRVSEIGVQPEVKPAAHHEKRIRKCIAELQNMLEDMSLDL